MRHTTSVFPAKAGIQSFYSRLQPLAEQKKTWAPAFVGETEFGDIGTAGARIGQ